MVLKSRKVKRGGAPRSICPSKMNRDECNAEIICRWDNQKNKCYKRANIHPPVQVEPIVEQKNVSPTKKRDDNLLFLVPKTHQPKTPGHTKPTKPVSPKPQEAEPLPIGWTEYFDSESGDNYYVNETTGQSQWERPHASPKPVSPQPASPKPASPKPASPKPASPKPASPKPASPKPASPKPVSPKPASPKPASPQLQQAEPLPIGWAEHFDSETGENYYVNETTGQSQWERPHASPKPASPKPASPEPIQILKLAEQNNINSVDIFRELTNRLGAKKIAESYKRKLQDKWRAGEVGPTLYKSKMSAIDTVNEAYTNFILSVINDGVIRPFNSPPKKIETVRDWADAIETLYGFTNYYEQALFTKPISKDELQELKLFCKQYTDYPDSCVEPCAMTTRGVINKKLRCSVKDKNVDNDRN
jgi:hypothetical protein